MNFKKLIVLFGTSAAVLAPLTSALSCGGFFAKTVDKNTTIRFGMRGEDAASWKPIINAFEKRIEEIHNTNPEKYPVAYKIKVVVVGDQKASYALWGASGMPDISLADPDVATQENNQANKWFRAIDPIEFLGTKNNDQYKLFDDQKGINFSTLNQDTSQNGFFESAFIPYKNGQRTTNGHEKLVALPYQYGPSVISLNTLFLDQTKTIKLYVPDEKSPIGLKMIKDTGKKATSLNIRKFIAGSGDKNNFYKEVKDSEGNIIASWSGYGPGNMYQRIASVGISAISDRAKNKDIYAWAKDIRLPFEAVASAPKGQDVSGELFDKGVVNDDVLQQIFTKGGYVDNVTMQYLYDNLFGYFKNAGGYAAPPVVKSQPGEAEMMRDQQAMILLGKKWSRSFFSKGWKGGTGTKSVDQAVIDIPVPYGSANMDGIGIGSTVSGPKLEVCKEFIKLAMSMHKDQSGRPFAYIVSRDIDRFPNDPLKIKALPTSIAARNYIQALANKSNLTQNAEDTYFAPFGMGQKVSYTTGSPKINGEVDSFRGVPGFFASSSTKGFEELVSNNVSKSMENWVKSSKEHLTFVNARNLIKKGVKDAYKEFDLLEE